MSPHTAFKTRSRHDSLSGNRPVHAYERGRLGSDLEVARPSWWKRPPLKISDRDSTFRFAHGTAYSTMDRKKLAKLWKEIAGARRCLKDASDLEALAALAGRTSYSGGNHVMWQSAFPDHRPIPIPRHGGSSKVGHRPQKVILDQLEADAAAWEDWLDDQERGESEESGGEGDGYRYTE